MQFSLTNACLNSLPAKFGDKIRSGGPQSGAEGRVGSFRISDAISRERCEIELR